MAKTISFTVNGQSKSLTTNPERPLLDVLREEFQLTGAKYGCGEGQCRACTVLINGKPTPSCLTTIGEVDKDEILTIEGLANGDKLHPVQEAFLAEGAFQCGYCTAGMILETVAFLKENPHPTEADRVARMQKHLCRCCTYPRILKAISRAAGGGQKLSSQDR
jgi:aerobic-type carbon monoxide dehydrogenase small subunit (CoxS/CutS family)